eukprot:64414_1
MKLASCETSIIEEVEAKLESQDVFKDSSQCREDNVLNCKSLQRIKIILIKWNKITQSTIVNECKDELDILIRDIFHDNNYTMTQLLNDFNHIKYDHYVDENDLVFGEVFQYFTKGVDIICNPRTCRQIERYYRDRSKLVNGYMLDSYEDNSDYIQDFNTKYIFNMITRIHVYFIHSNNINKFTLNDITTNDLSGDDEIYDKQLTMMAEIMTEKRKRVGKSAYSQRKYIHTNKYITYEAFAIDFGLIHQHLKARNISITETELRTAFKMYNDKNDFIADVIEALFADDDQELSIKNRISPHNLPCNQRTRKKIYACILKKYIKPHDLNTQNFITVAKKIIMISYPHIEVDEFVQTAMQYNIIIFSEMVVACEQCLVV